MAKAQTHWMPVRHAKEQQKSTEIKWTPGKHAASSVSWVLTQGWLGLTRTGELHAVSHLENKGQLALRRLSVLKHQLLVLLFSERDESTLIHPS